MRAGVYRPSAKVMILGSVVKGINNLPIESNNPFMVNQGLGDGHNIPQKKNLSSKKVVLYINNLRA